MTDFIETFKNNPKTAIEVIVDKNWNESYRTQSQIRQTASIQRSKEVITKIKGDICNKWYMNKNESNWNFG